MKSNKIVDVDIVLMLMIFATAIIAMVIFKSIKDGREKQCIEKCSELKMCSELQYQYCTDACTGQHWTK